MIPISVSHAQQVAIKGIKTACAAVLFIGCFEDTLADFSSAVEALKGGDYVESFSELDPLVAGALGGAIFVVLFLVAYKTWSLAAKRIVASQFS